MSQSTTGQIDNVMHEARLFPPSPEFSARARIGSMEAYQELYDRSIADPVQFWGDLARAELHWFEPFSEVMQARGDTYEWFVGGKTNVSWNCLDAHVAAGRGERTAILWEGEPEVDITQKPGIMDTMDGTHQVADLLRGFDAVDLPLALKGMGLSAFGDRDQRSTEEGCKKEIAIQKQHIGIDVEESECDGAVADGLKG